MPEHLPFLLREEPVVLQICNFERLWRGMWQQVHSVSYSCSISRRGACSSSSSNQWRRRVPGCNCCQLWLFRTSHPGRSPGDTGPPQQVPLRGWRPSFGVEWGTSVPGSEDAETDRRIFTLVVLQVADFSRRELGKRHQRKHGGVDVVLRVRATWLGHRWPLYSHELEGHYTTRLWHSARRWWSNSMPLCRFTSKLWRESRVQR